MKLNESRKLAINHPSIICCSMIKICVAFRAGKGIWGVARATCASSSSCIHALPFCTAKGTY